MDEQKPKGRWFQYRLKSLFLLTLVVGLALAFYLYWDDWRQQGHRYSKDLYASAFEIFTGDLKAGRLDHAYESTSARFKGQMSRSQFDGLIRRYPAVRQGPGTRQAGQGREFRSFNKQTLRNWIRHHIAIEASDHKFFVIWAWVVMDDSFFYRRPPPPRVEEIQIHEVEEIQIHEFGQKADLLDPKPSWDQE